MIRGYHSMLSFSVLFMLSFVYIYIYIYIYISSNSVEAKSSVHPHSRISSNGEILPPAGIASETVVMQTSSRSIRDKVYNQDGNRGIIAGFDVDNISLLSPGFAGLNVREDMLGVLHIIDGDGRNQESTTALGEVDV